MQTLITDFGRGIDTRGLHALPNSVADMSNLTVRNGSAQTVAGPSQMPAYTHNNGTTGLPTASASFINDKLIVKDKGWLWHARPLMSGAAGLFFSPLWIRSNTETYLYGPAAAEPETVTAMQGQTFISLLPREEVNLDDYADACLCWGGCSATWTVSWSSAQSTETRSAWSLIHGVVGPEELPPLGSWMFYGTLNTDTRAVTWAGRARVEAVTYGGDPTDGTVWTEAITGNLAVYNIAAFADIDPVGIPKPTAVPVATVISSTTQALPLGTYRYYARYISWDLNIAGLVSEPSQNVTISEASKGVALTLAETPGDNLPYWVDKIEFYRQMSDPETGEWNVAELAAVYGLSAISAGVLSQQPWPTGTACVDDAAAGEFLPGDAYWHVRPPALTNVRNYSGRLYGITGHPRNRLRFSTVAAPHSWPAGIANATSYEDMLWTGGEVVVGDSSPIMAIAAEGSAFSETGTRGESLLVVKQHTSHRWIGNNWEDFYLSDPFDVGTRDGATVRNCNGRILMVGPQDLIALPQGGSTPERVSLPIWPTGRPVVYAEARWSATYRNGQYIFSDGSSETWALDLQALAFAKLTYNPLLTTGRGPYTTGPNALLGMQSGGMLTDYFSDSNAAQWTITSPLIPMVSKEWDLAARKHVRRVTLGFWNASGGTHTLAVSLVVNGANTLATKAVTVPYVANEPYQSVTVAYNSPPGQLARFVQVAVSCATPTRGPGLRLEWIGIDYDVKRGDRADVL